MHGTLGILGFLVVSSLDLNIFTRLLYYSISILHTKKHQVAGRNYWTKTIVNMNIIHSTILYMKQNILKLPDS